MLENTRTREFKERLGRLRKPAPLAQVGPLYLRRASPGSVLNDGIHFLVFQKDTGFGTKTALTAVSRLPTGKFPHVAVQTLAATGTVRH